MMRRVGRQDRRRVRSARRAPAAVALVEEHSAILRRIEQPPRADSASGAWTAMQKDSRPTVRVAADLPVDPLAVADVEHPLLVRLDGREALHGLMMRDNGLLGAQKRWWPGKKVR